MRNPEYCEIMDHLSLTEEERNRILEQAGHGTGNGHGRKSFRGKIAAAAAVVAIFLAARTLLPGAGSAFMVGKSEDAKTAAVYGSYDSVDGAEMASSTAKNYTDQNEQDFAGNSVSTETGNSASYGDNVLSDNAVSFESAKEAYAGSAAADRKLIKDITLDLETTDLDAVRNQVEELVQKYSGYDENSSLTGEKPNRSLNLTVRVPAEKLDALADELQALGTVTYLSSSQQDVTLNFIDQEARLQSLKDELASLRRIMESATELSDVLSLETQITSVQAEIDSLTSQLNFLQNQVNYSTVYLNISETEAPSAGAEAGIGDRIRAGWQESSVRLKKGLENLAVWLGVNVFYLLAAAVIVAVIAVIRRLGSKKKDPENPDRNE